MNNYTYSIVNIYVTIQYNYSYFDGNTTITKWESPWSEPEYINESTDGITFKPFLK